MSNKNSSEELQTRREFFKKAAKAALPVVGAVVLANLPISKSFAATDCDYSCTNSCSKSCQGGCEQYCKNDCSNQCQWGCKGGCSDSCYGGASMDHRGFGSGSSGSPRP